MSSMAGSMVSSSLQNERRSARHLSRASAPIAAEQRAAPSDKQAGSDLL